MKLHVDVHIHLMDPAAHMKLDKVVELVTQLLKGQTAMSAELDRLTTEVAETKTVTQSAIVLLGQLSDLIRQNANDPTALNALADQLDSNQADLANAVAANTPAAPPA